MVLTSFPSRRRKLELETSNSYDLPLVITNGTRWGRIWAD
nr:MAG TPA: hypothetical protein [Caudoviricetes sp.]